MIRRSHAPFRHDCDQRSERERDGEELVSIAPSVMRVWAHWRNNGGLKPNSAAARSSRQTGFLRLLRCAQLAVPITEIYSLVIGNGCVPYTTQCMIVISTPASIFVTSDCTRSRRSLSAHKREIRRERMPSHA